MNTTRPPDTVPADADDRTLAPLRLIQTALAGGVALFTALVVAIRLGVLPIAIGALDADATRLLSLVHLGLFVAALTAGPLLQSRILEAEGGARQPGRILAAVLVRLALLEGAAVFGLVVLLLIDPDVLRGQPVWWANLASPIVFLLVALSSLPDRDRLRDLDRRRRHATPGR